MNKERTGSISSNLSMKYDTIWFTQMRLWRDDEVSNTNGFENFAEFYLKFITLTCPIIFNTDL
jgi:hypothetical protein